MLYIDSNANQRFRLGVHCAGGFVAIAAFVGTYALQYAPTIDATQNARNEIRDIQRSLRTAPAVHRDYTQLSEQLQKIEERLARIRRRVPQQANESEFLSSLANAAEEAGVVITNLNSSTPHKLTGYAQIDLSVVGSASYESICRFVDRIGSFPRLAKVVGLDVTTDADGKGAYPVTIKVAIYYDLVAGPGGKR